MAPREDFAVTSDEVNWRAYLAEFHRETGGDRRGCALPGSRRGPFAVPLAGPSGVCEREHRA